MESDQAGAVINVVISTPLEPEIAARIAAEAPAGVNVVYRPDLVPPPRYPADHDGDPAWSRTPEQEREWRSILRTAEVTWGFPEIGDDGPLVVCPNLCWIQGTSSGVGTRVRSRGLDRPEAAHVWITTASGIHARPLAEFVFAALLYHVKRIPHLLAEQRAHRWERFAAGGLCGQTLAIVGPGRIGREVANLGRAFGMRVVAMARQHSPERVAALGVDRLYARDEFHEMLRETDALVLVAPHTPETEGMMGAAEFAALKPGAVFVNIGRGVLVDEDALLAALQDGRIAFAALDVFRTEPLPPDSPFWDLPNVLINPHSASTLVDENERIADIFLNNLRHYVVGHPERMEPQYVRERGY